MTAIEKLLVFLVDAYRSLFLCFIELLVRGSLALLMSAVEIISDAVTSTAQTVRSAIQAAISDVNSAISTAVDGVNDIIGVFGQSIKAPQFTIPSLDALNNITIPTTFEDSLRNLNSSLPTLVDLKQKMDTLIETPFDKLKTDINGTISNFNFNRSLLPVPESNNLTFCNDLDTSSLDNLGHDLTKLAYIGLGILAAVAVGLMLLNMGREWWSWRSLEKHVEYTREAWLSIDSPVYTSHADRQQSIVPATVPGELLRTSNLFSLLQLSTHPLLAMLAFRFARPLGVKTPQARTSLRWFLAWISHPAAAAALVIGLVGLATVELQMAAIKPIQKHYEKVSV